MLQNRSNERMTVMSGKPEWSLPNYPYYNSKSLDTKLPFRFHMNNGLPLFGFKFRGRCGKTPNSHVKISDCQRAY